MTKSPGFLNEETHSLEREVKKKYLNFVKPIRFLSIIKLLSHKESKLIFMLGHLGGSPFEGFGQCLDLKVFDLDGKRINN